jgi:hypothetical protein
MDHDEDQSWVRVPRLLLGELEGQCDSVDGYPRWNKHEFGIFNGVS